MADKTYKTAVVIIPPQDVLAPIQAIREEHDRAFSRWMPHITLLYPFRPRVEFDAAATGLAQVCKRIQHFELTLATFNFFQHRPESYTLWLAPEPKDAVIQLQTALWTAFPNCDDTRRFEGGFTPHLSVGQVLGQEQMSQLNETLSSAWTPVNFQVTAVSLIWRSDPPDDVFRVGQTIALGTS